MAKSKGTSLSMPSIVGHQPRTKTPIYAIGTLVVVLALLVVFVNLLSRGGGASEPWESRTTSRPTSEEWESESSTAASSSAESSSSSTIEQAGTQEASTISTSRESSEEDDNEDRSTISPIVFPPEANSTTPPSVSSSEPLEVTHSTSESSTSTLDVSSANTATTASQAEDNEPSGISNEGGDSTDCSSHCKLWVVETIPRKIHFTDAVHTKDTFQGKELFDILESKSKQGVNIQVIDCQPPVDNYTTQDSIEMQKEGLIDRRGLEMNAINGGGGGIHHSKMFVVDRRHLFLGSMNVEWKSLSQKLELGLMFENCSCVAQEARDFFARVWDFLGGNEKLVKTEFKTHKIGDASVQLLASPPMFLSSLSSWDFPRLLNTIYNAETYVDIAVMQYFPSWIYFKNKEYFGQIDDAIRMSVSRGIKVRILVSPDINEHSELMFDYLRSLQVLCNVAENRSIEIKYMSVRSGVDDEKKSRRMHSKFIVTDTTAILGSSNYGPEYFYRSSGTAVSVTEEGQNRGINRAVRAVFERYWGSKYTTPLEEWKKAPETTQIASKSKN